MAGDTAGQRLQTILNIESTHRRLVRRVHDMKKNIEGARGEVNSLKSMVGCCQLKPVFNSSRPPPL